MTHVLAGHSIPSSHRPSMPCPPAAGRRAAACGAHGRRRDGVPAGWFTDGAIAVHVTVIDAARVGALQLVGVS